MLAQAIPRALAALLVAITLAIVGALVLISTTTGSRWLVGEAMRLSNGTLTVEGFSGTLLRGLEAERLVLRAGRTTVTLGTIELRMSWPDLFRRRVRLMQAEAEEVVIVMQPALRGTPDEPVRPLDLPFSLATDGLEIGRLTIDTGSGTPAELADVRLRGQLAGGELRFDALSATVFGITMRGRGRFGTGEPFPLDSRIEWSMPSAQLSGAGTVEGSLARLRIEQVVRMPDPVAVGAELRLLGERPLLAAEARWQRIARQFGDGEPLVSGDGAMKLLGWTDAWSGALDARLQFGPVPDSRVRLSARGSLDEIVVESLRVEGGAGKVAAAGLVRRSADLLTGALRLRATDLNPAVIEPRLTGRIDIDGALTFDSRGGFALALDRAVGTLIGRPLLATGLFGRDGSGFYVESGRVAAGRNRLEVEGRWGERLSGRFAVDAPELAVLWPDLAGGLEGRGDIGGTAARPRIDVDLTGTDLAYSGVRVEQVQVRGGIGARDALDVKVEALGIGRGERTIGDLRAHADGRLDDHDLRIGLDGGDIAVSFDLRGGWDGARWHERWQRAMVTLPGDQRWTLRDTPLWQFTDGVLDIEAHCWSVQEDDAAGTDGTGAEACLADTRIGSRESHGGVRLRRVPLGGLAALATSDLSVQGTADLDVEARREAERITGRLDLAIRDATFTYQRPAGEPVSSTLEEMRVEAKLDEDELRYQATVAESFGLRLEASGRVVAPFSAAPSIEGRIVGGIPDLSTLSPLLEPYAGIGDLQGRVTVDARLSGNARRPDIAGGLELADGAATVAIAGITIDRVALALQGGAGGTALIEGSARSGKGHVKLDGRVAFRDQVMPVADFELRGRQFEIIRLPEGTVLVSPDVRAAFREGQFRISGEVHVPRGALTLQQLGEGAVSPSPDTVVHGRELVTGPPPRQLFVLDGLRVELGNPVTFEGFGLKTRLSGSVVLDQTLAGDPTVITGDGVVRVEEGEFQALGQRLGIDRGSLMFAGPVTDPGLDVKASREVTWEGRDVTVGVLLSGRLSRIRTTVFSEPAMGEMDALSYLITGKPMSAAGAGDRFSVANAALSLGLRGALPVARQLGSALSVDEVGIGSTDDGGTALVVGERLGDDLFIRYSYGVFDKIGTVKATYRLGRRLSIEGTSGEEQALDLIYSINW